MGGGERGGSATTRHDAKERLRRRRWRRRCRAAAPAKACLLTAAAATAAAAAAAAASGAAPRRRRLPLPAPRSAIAPCASVRVAKPVESRAGRDRGLLRGPAPFNAVGKACQDGLEGAGFRRKKPRLWPIGHTKITDDMATNLVTSGWEYSSSVRRLLVRWYGVPHTLIPSPSKHVSGFPFLCSLQQLYPPAS